MSGQADNSIGSVNPGYMKLKILFFLLFTINFGFVYSQSIYRQDLNRLATIDFPDTPKAGITSGIQTYKSAIGSNSYVVLLNNLDNEDSIRTPKDLDNFYEGVVEGTLETSKSLKIDYKKSILIDGLKGLEFKYSKFINSNDTVFIYQRVLYFNSITFALMFTTFDDKQKKYQIERDKFFNSFTVIAEKKNIKQFTNTSFATKIGYIAGKTFADLLIVGLITLLVIFIAKRSSKKKKRYHE
jgi:hypothetical protein